MLSWQPGNHGKGLTDEHGNVHTWNEDEYPFHQNYATEHPEVGNPQSCFYIDKDGAVDVSYPSSLHDGEEHNKRAAEHILKADPALYHAKVQWDF
jgi:formylglycine-generating enzyme required for sulfatase activity